MRCNVWRRQQGELLQYSCEIGVDEELALSSLVHTRLRLVKSGIIIVIIFIVCLTLFPLSTINYGEACL